MRSGTGLVARELSVGYRVSGHVPRHRLLAVRAAVRVKMLTAIPGINCRHAEALISAYDGSLRKLMRASPEALAHVPVSLRQELGAERALAVKRALDC